MRQQFAQREEERTAPNIASVRANIEETRFYSMTAALTEVRATVAHSASSCEFHRPDLDSLISDPKANL
jgi:hypothetical protein